MGYVDSSVDAVCHIDRYAPKGFKLLNQFITIKYMGKKAFHVWGPNIEFSSLETSLV